MGGDQRLTYGELFEAAGRAAARLHCSDQNGRCDTATNRAYGAPWSWYWSTTRWLERSKEERKTAKRMKSAYQGALVERQRVALNKDIDAFIAADMGFHVAIAETTGNPIFIAVSRAMFEWLARFHTSLIHWKGSEHVTLEEHERILAALKNGDEGAAIREMTRHLERARSVYAPS